MAKLDSNKNADDNDAVSLRKPLTAEARRALDEAAERRRMAQTSSTAAEIGGRGGLDPVRYGDWEVKGIVSDF